MILDKKIEGNTNHANYTKINPNDNGTLYIDNIPIGNI